MVSLHGELKFLWHKISMNFARKFVFVKYNREYVVSPILYCISTLTAFCATKILDYMIPYTYKRSMLQCIHYSQLWCLFDNALHNTSYIYSTAQCMPVDV